MHGKVPGGGEGRARAGCSTKLWRVTGLETVKAMRLRRCTIE